MQVLFLLCAVALTLLVSVEGKFADRKIFVSKFAGKTNKKLPELELTRKQIRDQSIVNLRSLPASVKHDLAENADAALKGHYPVKTAIDFMEYFRDGNRNHYEAKLNDHRKRIAYLVLGNLLDQETNSTSIKYLDEVVNGLWMLMEESTWAMPAHLYLQNTSDHLPTPGRNAIDLGAGEVAKFLGWVQLLVGDKLDKISPVVNKRIEFELRKRIFQGFLDSDDFFWEGFHGHHVVNNWNIWVNGNILKCALFTLNDAELFDKVLNKTLYSADYFLDGYGEDGGCDEGPSYWRQAGGRLIEYLETLEEVFPGAKDYFATNELIKRVGQYSYKMRIEGNWFVNFADASPMVTYPPSLIAKYGILFNDDSMKQYSAFMLSYVKNSTYFRTISSDINEFFNFLNTHQQIESFKPVAPVPDLVWMPDIEVVNARSQVERTNKFFLAAKAGNNHESHNHNDVGNFVLYQNGFPVLIDIGVGTYTAKTFGAHRYELFYMQSQYHNCPTINGIQQKAGNEFNSHNVTLKQYPDNGGLLFSGDIAGAYPKESHTKQWIRSIEFNKTSNTIQLEDKFELDKFVEPQQLHFITVTDIEVEKDPQGLLLKQANVNVLMQFDWKLFSWKMEDKSLENDHHLTQFWGASVRRISLITNEEYKELNGHFVIRFVEAK